ncbi:MAG: hypothetical protein IT436_13890 [Phycisphaerales bacterium]|nr:hypothetical protein [Phycisphaerales bacterium]
MGCVIAGIAFFFPRLVMVVMVLAGDYLGRAYQTVLWPLLGFIFMPYTTLAYAWAKNSHGSVEGVYLAAVVVAVLLDLGVIGGGAKAGSGRARR